MGAFGSRKRCLHVSKTLLWVRVYANMHMRKVSKNLNLSIDVVEKLENEDNQSETVEELLREEYNL